ncbi:MAG: hypothetical protein MZW92_43235 [Comamonadaceae bacterium]|nr:hypothetical protein [Comamonadaceae bacterium]
MGLGLGVLALICLAWLPFAALLHPILPRRAGQRLGRLAIMAGLRGYLGFLQVFCACRFDLGDAGRAARRRPADPGGQPPFPARRSDDRVAPAQRRVRHEIGAARQPAVRRGGPAGALHPQRRAARA